MKHNTLVNNYARIQGVQSKDQKDDAIQNLTIKYGSEHTASKEYTNIDYLRTKTNYTFHLNSLKFQIRINQ